MISRALEASPGTRTDLTSSAERTRLKQSTLKAAKIPFQRAAENEKLRLRAASASATAARADGKPQGTPARGKRGTRRADTGSLAAMHR